MKYSVYRIYFIHKPNKYYIGITNKIRRRRQEHLQIAYGSHTNRNYSKPLYQAIRTYGENSLVMEILNDNLPFKKALELESKYIINFNSLYPNGYNKKG